MAHSCGALECFVCGGQSSFQGTFGKIVTPKIVQAEIVGGGFVSKAVAGQFELFDACLCSTCIGKTREDFMLCKCLTCGAYGEVPSIERVTNKLLMSDYPMTGEVLPVWVAIQCPDCWDGFSQAFAA